MSDPPREIVLSAGALDLAARVHGPPAGVPTLALHGWLDNAASYEFLAPQLPAQHVVALDFAGHGLSSHRPRGVAYHYVDHVADVLQAADALGWTRFALIGHSLGAGIATLLTAIAPERVLRAVLIEGLGPVTSPAEEAPATLRQALAEHAAAERATGGVYPTLEQAVRARMDGLGKVSERAALALCARGLIPAGTGYVWRTDRRLRTTSRLRLSEEHALAFIRAAKVPTLLVRAQPGFPFDAATYAARMAAHPNLRVEHIEGSHHVHMESPERVGALIRAFFAPLASGPQQADAL